MNYRKMARLNYGNRVDYTIRFCFFFFEIPSSQYFSPPLEQGKFFNSLSEFSPHGIFKTDAEGRWVYVNPKCAEICGQSAENLMGLGWISCLHPDDLDSVISKWKSHFEAGTEFQLDYRFLIEKEVRYISCMAKPIVGMNDKQRRAYVGNMEDVTEKKLTLQKEDLLQKQLQLSLSRFAVGIWERNLETEKIIWDSSMYDLYGVPPKAAGEVTYSTWYNVVHPDDRKQIVEGFDITNFATPDKHSRDDVSRFRIVKPDGQIRYIFCKCGVCG